MKNRIPPPILTLLLAALATYFAVTFGGYRYAFNLRLMMGFICAAAGLGIMLIAALQFRRQKTTVNPFRPEAARTLVFEGVYKFTRNPMYLGMALILIGVIVSVQFLPNILLLLAFIVYMTECQIKPEEQALTKKFGGDFTDYVKRVRRWL